MELENQIGRKLSEKGQTLSTAESCSGGLIAHRITNIAGSSAYFLGGLITYSNEAKMDLLDIPLSDLESEGAVSEEVAGAMAEGARRRFGADYGIGVTGIAGPGGGTREKPVGLVYIGIAGPQKTKITKNLFEGDRETIKQKTADKALELLWETLR